MRNDEITIIIAYKPDQSEVVCAFTDRESAMYYYKKLLDKRIPATITAIEPNTGKYLVQEFDL